MPKVSVAPLLGLLATKVPLVAVKRSNAAVSISVGPAHRIQRRRRWRRRRQLSENGLRDRDEDRPAAGQAILRWGRAVVLNEIDRLHRQLIDGGRRARPGRPQSFFVGGEHFLLGRLQLGHSRGGIRDLVDADRGPLRTQDDGLSGILNEEVPRDSLLGDELECAVLEVLVGDVAVVQERDVRVGGPGFLHQREGQCREPQHADPAGMARLRGSPTMT